MTGVSHAKHGDVTLAKIVGLCSLGLVVPAVALLGPTLNQTLAICISLAVIFLWVSDKFAGAAAGIIFFMTKSFWVRVAFVFDKELSGGGGSDLLGLAAPLILALLIVLQIHSLLVRGERLCPDRTRVLLLAFCFLGFASIFLPTSSPLLSLAGVERNILPNMMILFLMASLARRDKVTVLVKVLLMVGLISTIYAIGQYLLGLYPWEVEWFRQLAFDEGLSGRLTVGLHGIEFRIFSIFYGYMDFFFTNVIIFALAMTYGGGIEGAWRKVRIAYLASWFVILALSMERMPLVMVLIIAVALRYLSSSMTKRRKIVWLGAGVAIASYVILLVAGPYLQSTGADKLERMAELSDPFDAVSIDDRFQTAWIPALETIETHPLGVGIGYGSQTKASRESDSELYVKPHNEMIQKTLETGILGGLIYTLLLIYVYKDFIFIRRNGFPAFGSAMISATIAFWVCGIVNLPFSGLSGLTYWALAGMAVGLRGELPKPETEPYEKIEVTDNAYVG
jgi:hypothetical protein